MNDPAGLVQQLYEAACQRMETKVLERLGHPEHSTSALVDLINTVLADEQADLDARAELADANGETVQAEMYRAIRTDLLPNVADALRKRLEQR